VQERIKELCMPRLASLVSLFAIAAVGCVDAPDAALGQAEQAVIECDPWICGSNSPVIATYRFHELNLDHLDNDQGFSVISLWQAGIHYALSVEDGRIVGRAGPLEIRDGALQDAQIRLRRGAQTFAIKITAIGQVQTFARLLGASRTLQTYQLDMAELFGDAPPTGWRNVCSNPPPRTSPDTLGMNGYHSLVFEGERINRDDKTIDPIIDKRWFNIGCAGHALAKLAINAQTEAAHHAFGFNTTVLERQAFLKMLAADYCGTGAVFTVAGQPLQWMDWRGYTHYVSNPANLEIEARWGPGGVTCLNTPRVFANPTPLGTATFPNPGAFLLDLQTECGGALPPPCAGNVTDLGSHILISANPL